MNFRNSRLVNYDKDIEDLVNELLVRIDNHKEVFDNENLLNEVISIVKASGKHDFESRYGNYDNSFSLSELIKAYERDEKDSIRYLIYRYKFKHYPSKHIVNKFPIVLAIEPSKSCNLRCIMCFQSNSNFSSEGNNICIMDFGIYRKIMEESQKYNLPAVVFASRGEPLIHPQIDEMINLAYDSGVLDIKLNTNASLLTPEMSRKLLNSKLDTLVFSVDSIDPENYRKIRGYSLEKIISNINEFNKIRKSEFPESKLITRVSMVLVNSINKDEDLQKAKEFWSDKVDELGIKTENDFKGIYNPKQTNICNNPCSLLWERLYIWYDGKINPCDIDYMSELSLGSIRDKEVNIEKTWNGSTLNLMREQHLNSEIINVCSNCIGY